MYTSKWSVKIRSQKDKIIKRQKEGERILVIAEDYHVTESTLYKYFRRWGIEIIRCKNYGKREWPKKSRFKRLNHWKRDFSKKFLEARAARTKKYGDKVTYIKTKDNPHDKRLINNILNRGYL